jgi:DNA-binding response OmpR family regulator
MEKIHLLLVDDEEDFREATSEALSRRGFNVRMAENGNRALELIETALPDIVLLDLRMKEKDGIDTLTEIRQKYQDLPVIILTGHGELDAAMDSIRLKVVDFLQKPVDVEQLAVLIKKRLRGGKRTLVERSISALMVPITSYRVVYEEQTIAEVMTVLKEAMFSSVEGKIEERGHRSALVYDRKKNFVGCLCINDIFDMILPTFLKESPYSSYFTGMFLAQCKLIGNQPIKKLIRKEAIDVQAPLMEAVYLMATKRLINIPVINKGDIVGVLRDKDLFMEVADIICLR